MSKRAATESERPMFNSEDRKRPIPGCMAAELIARVVLLFVSAVTLAEGAALPGTAFLDESRDWKRETTAQLDALLMQRTRASRASRPQYWRRDFSSRDAYERSLAPNRQRLRERIGAVDARVEVRDLNYDAGLDRPALRAETATYEILAVQWPVLNGLSASGLLLRPKGKLVAGAVVIPDADQPPEALVGLLPGVAPAQQFPRLLAERGVAVLIPTLIDRRDLWSGDDRLQKYTDQSHREWIYRQAAIVGRHVVGYEVQKVCAAVDWLLTQRDGTRAVPVGVAGYGEGGLLALYSAALDNRISAAWVSGYFSAREDLWTEPLYRNVWRLLEEFGDAELATLVAPRSLVVEYSAGPELSHPPAKPTHSGKTLDRRTSAAVGRLTTAPWRLVRAEWDRALELVPPASRPQWTWVDGGNQNTTPFGSARALGAFQRALGIEGDVHGTPAAYSVQRSPVQREIDERQHRQFSEMQEFTQELGRRSEYARAEFFWKQLDGIKSPTLWQTKTTPLREIFWNEFIGKIPVPTGNLNARTRLLPEFENPRWSAYELIVDVWPGVNAWAYLLVPKTMNPAERRPVVVCQHGAAGYPSHVISRSGQPDYSKTWRGLGADLADRGFVVLAPNNPNAVSGQAFLDLQRKANPLGKSIFSLITANHQRLLEWLRGQPFVDPQRIAFYGLSYGGKTAVRVPALLPEYCLSICAGDWNDYVPKMMSVRRDKNTFMFTASHDTIEFNLANTFSYAEMAALIAPRPFMVENGYLDLVMPVEWASAEYAKLRKVYFHLGIPERIEMEYFDGPHRVNGVGTVSFLQRHLHWPQSSEASASPPTR
jgi:dienelactone hydrolase